MSLSIASKVLIRAPVGNGHYQHIFNPSNFGVACTLVLFPQVGFAPPYHFTENLTGIGDWVLPGIVLVTGIIIHALFTGRLLLCAAWIVGFILQGVVRAQVFGTPLYVPLMPMTSAAFILFTLYMIPDPATTPIKPARQIAFGFAVAMVYGILQVLHLVFGLFFALVTVCAIRGLSLHIWAAMGKMRGTPAKASERVGANVAATAPPERGGRAVSASRACAAAASRAITPCISSARTNACRCRTLPKTVRSSPRARSARRSGSRASQRGVTR